MNALPTDIACRRLWAPAVLLFGDDPQRRLMVAEVTARAGGRIVANAPIGDALGQIERQAAAGQATVGGVILDIRDDGGAALDALLIRLDQLGRVAGRIFSILIVNPALIDVVAARLDNHGTRILVEPSEAELAGAVADLVAPPCPWVEDGGASSNRRLAELSEEVGRIARALAALSSASDMEHGVAEPSRVGAVGDASLVRTLIRLRKLRGQYFMPELFADPAWDILLDLAVARIERRMVAVSSLCIAAAVPATTALRWIAQMTEQALLVRQPDPRDGRRVFIGLSDQASAGMNGYLAAARGVMAAA